MSLPVVPDLSFASLAALGVQISARVSSLLDPTSFNPSFYRDNFAGQGSCGGIKQSPIELPGGITPTLGAERTTVFRMPQAVSGATIENKGTGIEISWDPLQFDLTLDEYPVVQVGPGATGVASSLETYNPSFPSPPERTLTMVPVQMHWHVVSEHSVDGRYAALEAHIVTFVAPNQAPEWGCDGIWDPNGTPNLENCIAVFGVTYDLGPSSPSYISNTISAYNAGALRRFGDTTPYPGTLNLDAILPAARSHYTYPGSLTTPPCSETLLWHVFDNPGSVTAADQIVLEQMVAQTYANDPNTRNDYRHNNRPVQPRNSRPVFFAL